MAKLKLKKLPKKPKATASIACKESYLKKAAEVRKANAKIKALQKKSATLDKKISSLKNYV